MFLAPAYPYPQDGVQAGGASSYNQFATGVQQAFHVPQQPNATGTFSVDLLYGVMKLL